MKEVKRKPKGAAAQKKRVMEETKQSLVEEVRKRAKSLSQGELDELIKIIIEAQNN